MAKFRHLLVQAFKLTTIKKEIFLVKENARSFRGLMHDRMRVKDSFVNFNKTLESTIHFKKISY